MPSVPDKVQNISISDTTITIHTFRVRYMHCSFHCGKKKFKKNICSYKGCSSSLIRSFMSFQDEIGLLLGNSFEFHLLLWLAHDVTEWWQPQCHPLALSKWHFAAEVCCAALSLLLFCVKERQ